MVYIKTWDPEITKFHVYILHGVAEHSARYESLAVAITKIGGKVFAQDHKGHGKTAEADGIPLGTFTDPDPVASIISDTRQIINNTNPEQLPWILFGHSGGCLYAEHALSEHVCLDKLVGVILSGPPAIPSLIERVGFRVILNLLVFLNRGQWVINHLLFRKYDKQMRDLTGDETIIKNQWVCADPDEVTKFNNDRFCGHDLSFEFWRSFLSHLSQLLNESFRLNSECPVLLIGGDSDAATDFGRSLEDTKKRWVEKSKCVRVDQVLFRGMRHELVGGKGSDGVISIVSDWIKRIIRVE